MKTHTQRIFQTAMLTLMLVVSGAGVASVVPSVFAEPLDFQVNQNSSLTLMQPPDSTTTSLPAAPGLDVFYAYFKIAWPWILGCAAGIGVLQALIGGIEIMLSGSESASAGGKEKIKWALAGLLIIGLASVILTTLNNISYS